MPGHRCNERENDAVPNAITCSSAMPLRCNCLIRRQPRKCQLSCALPVQGVPCEQSCCLVCAAFRTKKVNTTILLFAILTRANKFRKPAQSGYPLNTIAYYGKGSLPVSRQIGGTSLFSGMLAMARRLLPAMYL